MSLPDISWRIASVAVNFGGRILLGRREPLHADLHVQGLGIKALALNDVGDYDYVLSKALAPALCSNPLLMTKGRP